MAVGPYIPGMAQIRPQYQDSEGRVDEVIFYVLNNIAGPWTLSQLTTLQSNVDTVFESWSGVMPSTCKYIGSIVTDRSSNTGLEVTNIGFTPVPGTDTAIQAPRQVAALLSVHGPTRYRGGHSRIYMPQIAQAMVGSDGQTLNSTAQTSLNALFTNMNSRGATIVPPVQWAILHSRQQEVPHTVPPTYLPATCVVATGATASNIVATQRRRLRKVAHH